MITLDKAASALKSAEAKAAELGIVVSIAVVDDYGVLVAFSRMDGALHISPRFAHAKAFTAAALGMPSGDVAAYAGEGKPYFSVNTSFGGEMMIIAGGLPVKMGGKIVGAVGVGGSTDVNQDILCAKAAVDVLENGK
ncbi:heme-binding protein [bacterium]|nr:heme-binding protein [bacterium]